MIDAPISTIRPSVEALTRGRGYAEWFFRRVEKRAGIAVFRGCHHRVAAVGYSAAAYAEREGREDHETVAKYYGLEVEDVRHAVAYWRAGEM